MLERIRDRNIWLIYAAILLLGTAYGISIALTSLFLDARHYSKDDIGTLAGIFALGLVTFSLPMGGFIRRFTARTVLVTSLFGYAALVAAFPYAGTYWAIAGIRFLDGAFSVGIWVSCETVLLARADEHNKAFVTSLYGIAMGIGYVIGPLLARAVYAVSPGPPAFIAASVIGTLAAFLVLARLDSDAAEFSSAHAEHGSSYRDAARTETPSISTGTLLWRIKTSCFATFSYGYFQGAVVLFLPLYLVEVKHVARDSTILLPAFFAAGMLLVSNFTARIGDKRGHLAVMRVLGVIGTVMIAGFVFLDSFVIMAIAVFIAGSTLASISAVSLALQGVVVERKDYSRANAFYNAFYASGMLLGPPISSRIYGKVGGIPMLYHLAGLWTAFVIFTVIFRHDDPAARSRVNAPAALRS